MIPHRWIVEDPYVPPGQFFGIPATVREARMSAEGYPPFPHAFHYAPHDVWVDDGYFTPDEPATIGHDMEPHTHRDPPIDPLDRTLDGHDTRIKALAKHVDVADAALSTRIARLEYKDVTANADAAKGRRLIGSLLVLIGRRLRDEEDE